MVYSLSEISAAMSNNNVKLYRAIWTDHTSMMLSERNQVRKEYMSGDLTDMKYKNGSNECMLLNIKETR